jgi:hypothetical protein
MERKQIAAMGIVSVLLGAGGLLASAGSASAAPARAVARHCAAVDATPWPASVNGRPDVDAKTASGTYVWHDGAGFHVRVTHRDGGRRTFSGRLETAGRFVSVKAVRLEGHDIVRLSADRHTLTFRFGNYGAVDGLGFRVACAPSIAFHFASDGGPAAPADVRIGHDADNPDTVPFAISRS